MDNGDGKQDSVPCQEISASRHVSPFMLVQLGGRGFSLGDLQSACDW